MQCFLRARIGVVCIYERIQLGDCLLEYRERLGSRRFQVAGDVDR